MSIIAAENSEELSFSNIRNYSDTQIEIEKERANSLNQFIEKKIAQSTSLASSLSMASSCSLTSSSSSSTSPIPLANIMDQRELIGGNEKLSNGGNVAYAVNGGYLLNGKPTQKSNTIQISNYQSSQPLTQMYATTAAAAVASSTGAATQILNSVAKMSLSSDSKESSQDKERNDEEIISYQNRIDQLELINTVGTGTFGRVIACRNRNSSEYYALKVMSIAEVLRLKQTEHVKNEKEILSLIKHPFIINL
jgi:hypothetical protein